MKNMDHIGIHIVQRHYSLTMTKVINKTPLKNNLLLEKPVQIIFCVCVCNVFSGKRNQRVGEKIKPETNIMALHPQRNCLVSLQLLVR